MTREYLSLDAVRDALPDGPFDHVANDAYNLATQCEEEFNPQLRNAAKNWGGYKVKGLIDQGANPNHKGGYTEKTPLHFAAENGDVYCIQELLKYGANPRIVDQNGKTPLQTALTLAKYNDQSIIALIDAVPSQVNDTIDARENTPLHLAAKNGGRQLVQHLVDKESALERINDDGLTPIQSAAYSGNIDNVDLLESLGADTPCIDKEKYEQACRGRLQQSATALAWQEAAARTEAGFQEAETNRTDRSHLFISPAAANAARFDNAEQSAQINNLFHR